MTTILEDFKLESIKPDGCDVGVWSKLHEPSLKSSRIAVSSQHMKQALDGMRCQGSHEHVSCAKS